MKFCLHIVYTAILIAVVSCKPSPPTSLSSEGIIPKPVSVASTGSSFELTNDTEIYVNGDAEVTSIGQYLSDKLSPATGFELPVKPATEIPGSGNIYITTHSDGQLGTEGYVLIITEELITLSAPSPSGLFHGIQTLRQILPYKIESTSVQKGPWKISTGVIRDYPNYGWRGTMLDVARHFFSVEDVKRYIDLASFYKMNIMHLHLSDDQGWRIEIKSWPNLTAHGGSTQVGGGKSGFFTQEQYSDIVAYAQSRYMTIVPEIDLPGHINSALASYGELNGGTIVPEEGRVTSTASQDLGSKSKSTELYTGVEVGWSTLRVEKEITFKFVEDVIREISALTPGPYFHIGGDEAAATKKQDYITFINRFKEIVKKNNKIMIGWEEIAQANIGSEIITQYWKLSKYADLAVEKESKLIMSPAHKAYLDMSYDSTSRLGLHWAAYIEVDSAYQWNLSTQLKEIEKQSILGIEAPLWSETIATIDELEYLAFPRLPGYAELGWSQETNRSWEEYRVRLGNHGARMKEMGIDFYRSPRVTWKEK
jgi:hexosaminidase